MTIKNIENDSIRKVTAIKLPILLIFLACILLLGMVIGMFIPARLSFIKSSKISPTQSAISTENTGTGLNNSNQVITVDAAVQSELANRVNNAITFLQILMTAISVIGTLLIAGLGSIIWQTRRYAKRVIDENLLDAKQKTLDPMITKIKLQMDDQVQKGLLLNVEATHLIQNAVITNTLEIYHAIIDAKDLPMDKKSRLLGEMRKRFLESQNITEYLVASSSKQEAVVQDVCQKLQALANSNAVKAMSEIVLEQMTKLLDAWPQGETRAQIQRVIDLINKE